MHASGRVPTLNLCYDMDGRKVTVMSTPNHEYKILVVDDEWESAILQAVRHRLEEEGWRAIVVRPEGPWASAQDFELAALYAAEEEQPDAVLLDVRFGDQREDRFKGLDILRGMLARFPAMPILMFTQYTQGPDRDAAVRGALKWDAPVDFIDKLASPEEVVLRLRRLIGTSPRSIGISGSISLDLATNTVLVKVGDTSTPLRDIQGMKFEILKELTAAWYRSPGELVPFGKLERYSEGDDPRASLRVRIREIKDALGQALGTRFGAGELIINVRDQGYRLVPPQG